MKKNQENQEVIQSNNLLSRSIIIGLVGGLLWSSFLAATYYFNFTEVAPKTYLLKPWIDEGWTDRFIGHVIAILLATVFSLIPTVIYYSLFRKINSMWVGVGYGIFLWGVIFFLLQIVLPNTRSMLELNTETWVTTLCVFILYGLFVGYSISYDYQEMEVKLRKRQTES